MYEKKQTRRQIVNYSGLRQFVRFAAIVKL